MKKDLKSLEQYYKRQEYQEGINWLLENKDSIPSGLFHYNLGTFYSKKEDFAAGRYNFEKAIKEGFVNTQVYHNLEITKQALNVTDISNSKNFVDKSTNYLLSIPQDTYLLFSLLILLIVLILNRLKIFKNYIIVTILLLVSFLPLAFKKIYLDKLEYAINLHEANLYEGPSSVFAERGVLKPGTKVIIGQRNGDWLFIKSPLLLAGWVNKKDMALY
ncbi:MAG: SH3 domain-containing protein [Bdellovibrionales bacterium]|nr:SH3 domain-containing protein [Bdellovibrionales bacterium]